MAKKKKDKDFPWSLIASAVLTFIAGIVLMYIYGEDILPKTLPTGAKPTATIKVYFSDESGKYITAERHIIEKGTIEEQIKESLNQLILGPKNQNLATPMPDGTKVISVAVKQDTAFIKFSKELKDNHMGGSSAELQTVFSIVNTVTKSFGNIKFVQILIDNADNEITETLAGHIMINIPLMANNDIVSGN